MKKTYVHKKNLKKRKKDYEKKTNIIYIILKKHIIGFIFLCKFII